MSQTICIFGDSIAWGAFDNEKGGWVNRLKLFYDNNNYDSEIYNLSISGDTTADAIKRFKSECQQREPGIIIIALGINDSKIVGQNNNDNFVPINDFKANITQLIAEAKEVATDVIVLGLLDIDESKTMPVMWEGKETNTYFSKKNQRKYNSVLHEISSENKVFFVDMLDVLHEDDFTDGLHPNANGHEKIFLHVKNFMINNQIIH